MTEAITRLDFSVLYWIQDHLRCGFLDFLMPKITFLGNAGLIWLLAAAILILTPKYRRVGIFLLAGLAAGVLVGNVAMKHLFARPRPCWLDPSIRL
ncbi:MAG TPA: phosphatase PAP2 family protein, partial [Clostridiales bacterium]|nr:phosphatase PAP2 family protein [Clostridiales bacterium]